MTATTQGRRAKVVAWQYRKNVKGRHWTYCSESIAAEFAGLSDYQTRALVPADTLAEMQRRVEELADAWMAEASQMDDDPDIFACLPAAVRRCANEIRAILGGDATTTEEPK